jgi:Putative transposase/Transposase zinc-binding domain
LARPRLEVADIFRRHGPVWRKANAGHVSLGQLKVMSAIESCRTAALGGHVARCENDKCGHTQVAYNSCRNRHCPKCQGAAAREWLAAREAELLPVPYFHVVFSLPAQIADIAYQNKAVIYDILFKASAETLITIAADPKHLGARIGVLSVLHTWGSALTHHPHVHMIVPGGGISLARGEQGDSPTGTKSSERWIACRPGFFLPVRVLSRLFRRLVLEKLAAAHGAGDLQFFGKHAALTHAQAFAAYLAPLRNSEWVVYSKRPFGGPEEVLRYLARYTHRVAISNRRLVALNDNGVTFKWKDYRREGPERYGVMTLDTNEFIRRFLMHVLPQGFHRIRYYGLLTSPTRAQNIACIRALLVVPLIPIDAIKAATAKASTSTQPEEPKASERPCPCCGSRMRIIETFRRGQQPKHRPTPLPPKISIDSS